MGPDKNNESSLMDLYDSIHGKNPMVASMPPPMTPNQIGAYHHRIGVNKEILKNKCAKHIILDVYCNILPLDQDYVANNQGQMNSDVSAMLRRKNMTPIEYLSDAYEKTKAPMLEYVLKWIDNIGNCYVEEAEDALDDAKEGLGSPEAPPVPEVEEEPVNSQLVDLKNDMEYQNFVDILKKKTVDKIVQDVSDLIIQKKEADQMTFDTGNATTNDNTPAGGEDDMGLGDLGDMGDLEDIGDMGNTEEAPVEETPPEDNGAPAAESAFFVGMEYISDKLYRNKSTNFDREEIMSMAIREACLHQIDEVFRMESFSEFASNIRYGNGFIINEAAVEKLEKDSKDDNNDNDKEKKDSKDKVNTPPSEDESNPSAWNKNKPFQ